MLDRLLLPWRQPKPKAETGIGAFWLSHEPPLQSVLNSPQKKAQKAQEIGVSHRWIRAAERVISTSLGSVAWHLEDADDEPVTDESPEVLRSIRDVLEKPYRPTPGEALKAFPRTRSGLWGVTSRHMGLCGYAFWYADQVNTFAVPTQLLYVNPARMTPAGEGNELVGWVLDADARGRGVPLAPEQVLMFTLEEADSGWFPAGLVESAMTLVNLTAQGDRHATSTLASGGKRAGVYSPKAQAGTLPPDVFATLEKELRSAQEAPDAYRRSIILRGPVDYTPNAATPQELDLVALLNLSRDDTLELWGVPRSQLGGATPTGLNASEKANYDEAALWQKAVHPRIVRIRETIQFQLLDPIAERIGKAIELEIEEPTFDDDAPKYALAQTATTQPLRNVERRALLGLDPFGDPLLDNAVWMPLNIVQLAAAPEVAMGKGKLDTLRPKLAKALASFLAEQQREIVAKVRRSSSHVSAKPGDSTTWWDGPAWDARLRKLLAPYAQAAADIAAVAAEAKLGSRKAGEAVDLLGNRVLARLLAGMGVRITGINETTRQRVIDAIRDGILAGEGAGTIGDRIEDLGDVFGEYRGELIARTETARVLNEAALESYREYGVERVVAIDGDEDAECAARNGQEFDLDEAMDIEDHPNGTLDWVPIVGKAAAMKRQPPALPE